MKTEAISTANPETSGVREQTMAEAGPTDSLKDLLEYIARVLVDHPEEVRVSEVRGQNTIVLALTVAKDDMGKIIGKEGRTAVAIRTLLNNVAMKIRRRCVLEILE